MAPLFAFVAFVASFVASEPPKLDGDSISKTLVSQLDKTR